VLGEFDLVDECMDMFEGIESDREGGECELEEADDGEMVLKTVDG
jgi:hypothetical protein